MMDYITALVLGLMAGAVLIGLIEQKRWFNWSALKPWSWTLLPLLLPLGAWCWSVNTFVRYVRREYTG